MTRQDVQRWLDAYREAWQSYEPEQIAALFSADATYAYKPWEKPINGQAAIVADWLREPDPPGSWNATYEPMLIDGDRAIATGETQYANGKVFSNLFVLRFNDGGECSEFVEWYMLQPS
jgi:hypothetical protein